jgi:hypothetical protein
VIIVSCELAGREASTMLDPNDFERFLPIERVSPPEGSEYLS